GGGGAAVEAGDLAGPDHARRPLPDALFLRGGALGLVPQRQVVVDRLSHGTAADPGEHLLVGQLVEVPANGGGGHVQCLGRVFDLQLSCCCQQFQQVIPPAITTHQCLLPARSNQLPKKLPSCQANGAA